MSERSTITTIGSIAARAFLAARPLAASLFAASLFAAGCGGPANEGGGAVVATTAALSASCLPPLPSPTLAAPAGNRVAFSFNAVGVQIYACQATSPTTQAWVFQAPEATLFDKHGRVAGTHFAGPTWQANDGSQVVGAKVAGFTPDATAIPWLLLQAASHAGHGHMSKVTFIQRLQTVGGIAPAASTCDAAAVGQVARVDYTATYFFYRASDDGDDDRDRCGDAD